MTVMMINDSLYYCLLGSSTNHNIDRQALFHNQRHPAFIKTHVIGALCTLGVHCQEHYHPHLEHRNRYISISPQYILHIHHSLTHERLSSLSSDIVNCY